MGRSNRTGLAVYGTTTTAWLVLCATVFGRLAWSAANAPPSTIDDYARAPSFQLFNFVVGYLPGLLVMLALVIGVEYAALRLLERKRSPPR